MDEFPWVVLAEWADSSPTVHGPFATAEGAEESARLGWARLANCTRWTVLMLSDAPVPDAGNFR